MSAEPHPAGAPGERRTGTVAWLDEDRGFAFISPDGGGRELFADTDAERLRGHVVQGTAVAFECGRNANGRLFATNVVRIVASAGQTVENLTS